MRCKILFKSNRSQSHVEMIVSFVLFIGFVVFLLLVFNPQKYSPLSYGSIDAVQAILMKNLTVEYNYTSVILNDAVFKATLPKLSPNACFQIVSVTGISGAMAAKNIDGSTTYSGIDEEGKITIKSVDSQRFYGIYSAGFFSGLAEQCPNTKLLIKSNDYSLGILTTKSAVLYENLEELNNSYYSDYGGLKESLGIKNDFSFIVRNETNYFLFDTTSNQPQNINILSREIPFLSINKKGGTENLFINLRIW